MLQECGLYGSVREAAIKVQPGAAVCPWFNLLSTAFNGNYRVLTGTLVSTTDHLGGCVHTNTVTPSWTYVLCHMAHYCFLCKWSLRTKRVEIYIKAYGSRGFRQKLDQQTIKRQQLINCQTCKIFNKETTTNKLSNL